MTLKDAVYVHFWRVTRTDVKSRNIFRCIWKVRRLRFWNNYIRGMSFICVMTRLDLVLARPFTMAANSDALAGLLFCTHIILLMLKLCKFIINSIFYKDCEFWEPIRIYIAWEELPNQAWVQPLVPSTHVLKIVISGLIPKIWLEGKLESEATWLILRIDRSTIVTREQ